MRAASVSFPLLLRPQPPAASHLIPHATPIKHRRRPDGCLRRRRGGMIVSYETLRVRFSCRDEVLLRTGDVYYPRARPRSCF